MIIMSPGNVFSIFLLLCVQQNSFPDEVVNEFWPSGGEIIPPESEILRAISLRRINHPDEPVPDSFDAREKWPQCQSIRRIANRGRCNFCWAVATSMVLTDRLCIMTNATDLFEYSAEELLTCCSNCVNGTPINRCKPGGYSSRVVTYTYEQGDVSGGEEESERGCKPISDQTVKGHAPSLCERECTNPRHNISYNEDKRYTTGATFIYHRIGSWYTKQMQIEVMKNGPMKITMKTSPYFSRNYTNEIFQELPPYDTIDEAWHAVRLIGWGNENGTPYWLVANSWGKNWGSMGGFFKIVRDKNFLEIESYSLAPFPRPAASTKTIQEISRSVLVSLFFCYIFL